MLNGTYKCVECEETFDWCAILTKDIKYRGSTDNGICKGDINAVAKQIAVDKIRVEAMCPRGHKNVFEKEI